MVTELKSARKVLPGALAAEISPSPVVGRPMGTIEVVGNGEWRVAPDRVLFNLMIETMRFPLSRARWKTRPWHSG